MCQHLRKIGDNNGLSCDDCGEQLEGYGHRATGKHCMYHWDASTHDAFAICTWCGIAEPNENYDPNAKAIEVLRVFNSSLKKIFNE